MRLESTWSADAQEIAKPVISHLPGLGGGDGQLTSGQSLTEERFVVKRWRLRYCLLTKNFH